METLALWLLVAGLRRRVRGAGRDARPADRRRAQHLLARSTSASASAASWSTSSASGGRFASARSPAWRTRSCSGASSPSAATPRSSSSTASASSISRHTALVRTPTASILTPFAVAVLAGIVYLLDPPRVRAAGRRSATTVSVESIVIALFIATLMVTFLLTWRLDEAIAGRAGQLVGARARHPRRSWR